MINLHTETVNDINGNGYTVQDVAWVGTPEAYVTWDEFARIADDITYDNGYGWACINTDLRIIFQDGTWLKRYEYDGAEQWVHVKPYVKPTMNILTINDVRVH